VAIALEKKVVAGRRMRVDTTVVETNIHYPTDSTLMGDGVRVLTRVMKKVANCAAGEAGDEVSGSLAQCEAAHPRDRLRCPKQERKGSGEDEGRLP
jgi:hypothetical protein